MDKLKNGIIILVMGAGVAIIFIQLAPIVIGAFIVYCIIKIIEFLVEFYETLNEDGKR